MTAQEYSDKLTQLHGLVSGDLAKDTIVVSGAELLAKIKYRVVKTGRNSDNNVMGDYSTKPMYVERSQFVKPSAFNPQGKNSKFGLTMGDRLIPTARLRSNSRTKNPTKYQTYTVVKPNYKPRKTMYLPNGYRQLRDIQGMQVQFVNMHYSGRMVKDYIMQKEGQHVVLGINTERSAKIYDGLSGRFGKFFTATSEEQQSYIGRTNYLLERLTRNTITGVNVSATIS